MTLNIENLLKQVQVMSKLRKLGLAFILGAMATAAMPPWTLWPALWISLPIFLLLIGTAKTKRNAFYLGCAFGFGYFATGFAWIGNAFFVDSETFAALAIPSIGGLAAGFSVYIGIVCVALHVVAPSSNDDWPRKVLAQTSCRVVVFATVWALVEWWRGWFLTGLPWNPLGSTWVAEPIILQGASIFGVYGLTLFTVLAASSLIFATLKTTRRTKVATVSVCHAPLIFIAVWGALRLAPHDVDFEPGIMLRLVQPNIAQVDKWRSGQREQHVLEQVRMSTTDAAAVTHVLWAETAVPFPLNQAMGALSTAAQAAPKNGYLLTGAPRIEGRNAERRAYNSLFVVNPDAKIMAVYDKAHLVPFGEYMPLKDYIPIPQITGGTGFTSGDGLTSILLEGLPSFSPLICYEVIFSGAVVNSEERPQWLFNLTNDAWFGDSSGPHQHLAAAQMRAVEEGLPLVRVANTGISAVIDGYGRITGRIPLGSKGVLDRKLPKSLEPTPFSRFGHWPLLSIIAILTLAAGLLSRNNSKNF